MIIINIASLARKMYTILLLLLLFCLRYGNLSAVPTPAPTPIGNYNFEFVDGLLPLRDEFMEGSGEYLDDDPEEFVPPVHYRLEHYLKTNYNNRVIPRRNPNETVKVSVKMEIYQIIEMNEPQQYILLNAWIVERWNDDLLYWNPARFSGLRQISLPVDSVWIPDTTLYNSLEMDEAESRRLINVKITTIPKDKTTLVELLYPTLYKSSCLLDLRTFPFDLQSCKLTFGSWTHDNKAIDYYPHNISGRSAISTKHCIENEEWNILGTKVMRKELKFDCCVHNYTLLEFHIHIQRKPLYYVINLITPTAIITLIAIFGFFSSSTINDVREEKMSLGITTLLSMSILIFMVSDKMPNMGTSVPLIGWYYTSSITLISTATLAASIVIFTQKKGILGRRPTRMTMKWARRLGKLLMMKMPLLMVQAYALKAKQDKIKRASQRKMSVWQRWTKMSKDVKKANPSEQNTVKQDVQSPTRNGPASLNTMNEPSDIGKRKINFHESTYSEMSTMPSAPNQIRFADDDINDNDTERLSDDEKSWDASGQSMNESNGMDNLCFQPSRSVSLSSGNQYNVRRSLIPNNSLGDIDMMDGTFDLSNMTSLQQRNLAQIEWDWIAAVIERAFLCLFNFLFFLSILLVTLIGIYCCYYMVDLNDSELER